MDVIDKTRYCRAMAYQGLHRGRLPTVNFSPTTGFGETIVRGFIFAIAFCVAAFLLAMLFKTSTQTASQWANIAFSSGFLIGTLLPYVKVLTVAIIHRQKPDFNLLRHFSLKERIVANAIIALLILSLP